jgi:nucleoside-diphosphate-sugar epimerase
LVTGGLGFIGSNLVLSLLEAGSDVTVVDPCIPGCGGNPENLGNWIRHVRWLPFDIGHTEILATAIRSSEVIFNLAGEIRHHHSMLDPRRDLDLNVRSQLMFLQACVRWNPGVRVIYAGTRQVYGVTGRLPVDEGYPVEPVDFNGVHKQAAAAYHLLLSRQGLLDACVLHLSNVYGPRMALEVAGQGFLSTFVRRLREGKPLRVYGDGRQVRDPIYVDDAVEAFLLAARSCTLPSRIYNLGGPAALTLLEIATIASTAADAPPPELCPFPPEQLLIDIGDYQADTRRIRSELGWLAQTSFREGILLTLQAYGITTTQIPEGSLCSGF